MGYNYILKTVKSDITGYFDLSFDIITGCFSFPLSCHLHCFFVVFTVAVILWGFWS